MSVWRLAEAAAWIAGLIIFGWMLLDAWRTGRVYDEGLLTSSREGEIEKDLGEVAQNLDEIEARIDGGPVMRS